MTIVKIKSLYDAQPFQSFVIHPADGRGIPVLSREFMAAAPSGRTVIVYQPDERHNIIDLLSVTDLEVKPAKNGGKRKRA